MEDVETILETLVFDGKVERSVATEGAQGVRLYRAVTSFLPTPSLMTVPCGVCPVSIFFMFLFYLSCDITEIF